MSDHLNGLPRPEGQRSAIRFCISATFTAEPLKPYIAFWAKRLCVEIDVRFLPYNQVHQALLDPHSDFATNHHGVNVMLVRAEDFGHGDDVQVESNFRHLEAEIRSQMPSMHAPLMFVLCPPSERIGVEIAERFGTVPGVHYLSHRGIDALYPVADWEDAEAEKLGHIPYTDAYYAALATAIVRRAHAVLTPPRKAIVLDCDNTLWQGICGEDGPSGVVLDPARRFLQEFMLEQRNAGMLLCMASKNNEQDVLDTFALHPEMPLQLRHFTSWRLNWEAKPENLASLAEELGLGLESFIFIDDNPKECAEVENGAPEVLSLVLPQDISTTPRFLRHVWAFDHPVITDEDRKRAASYDQKQRFDREVRAAGSLEEFLSTLKLELRIEPVGPGTLPRAAQLTQRTNQFNFTTIRRHESDIEALLRHGHSCWVVHASDRFGDYGLVGLIIYQARKDVLDIDTVLLSCRALGRGIEHRMLAFVGARAAELDLPWVNIHFRETSRNMPARRFLESICGPLERDVCRFRADGLAALEWKSYSVPPAASRSAAASRPVLAANYAAIAALSEPERIVREVRAERRHDGTDSEFTDTERNLAAIWSDLLERPITSSNVNFFDAGGHSLLAVLLVVRVRETFGIELPVDDVYSTHLTLADLARKIELYQLSQLNPEEYGELLAEIEALSDEQVQALLASSDAEAPS